MRKAILFTYTKSAISKLILILLMAGFLHSAEAQVDCPPITPFCHDIHTSFMSDVCMVEIWAKDFIRKINAENLNLDDFIITFDQQGLEMSRIYRSVDSSFFEVTIWITSKCDPDIQTRCIANLYINDNTGRCPGPGSVCPVDPNPWCGFAVVTCTTIQESPTETTGHVAAIIDMRKNSQAPRGDDWSEPVGSPTDPVVILRPEAWRISNIGNVYGIALKPSNGFIFLAASDVYDFDFQQFVTVGPPPPSVIGEAGSGGIYRSLFSDPENTVPYIRTLATYPSPANFNATVLGGIRIPNTGNIAGDSLRSGNGIGNIAYDINSDHLFASNLEDGKIYSINTDPREITAVLDPWDSYIHSPGMVNKSERIWGLAVLDCGSSSRLFFARNSINPASIPDVIDAKEIWSIAINEDGTFGGTERIELIVELGDQAKLTDLAFNESCNQLLVAERGNAHSAELHRYFRQPDDSWIHDRQFFVGLNDPTNQQPDYPLGIRGNSSAGGVAFGPREENCVIDAACDELVWGTINCGDIEADDDLMPSTPFECRVYGAQGIDRDGNNPITSKETDIFASFNTSITINNLIIQKSNIGEIEIFSCCCPEDPGRQTITVGTSAIVAGEVFTEKKYRVDETKISIFNNFTSKTMMTNPSGQYMFEELEMHHDYNISPEKSGQISDGISTLDLVLIQRHILDLKKLDSPYKMIAADINDDHRISSQDLVTLRRIILGSTFGNDLKPWAFVPSEYKFKDEANPFPFPTSINLNDLEKNSMHEDFVAIKKGDVNGDNRYNILGESRSTNSALLDIQIINNRAYVSLNKNINLSGLQFELFIGNHVSVKNILPGAINLSSDNYLLTQNSLRLSWNTSLELKVNKGDLLFSFDIDNTKGNIETLSFKQSELEAQAYDNNSNIYDLQLGVEQININTTLIGNSPNPFSDETVITFDLEKSGMVSFEFYSIDSRKIFNIDQFFAEGRNVLKVQSLDLNNANNNIIVYKMILDDFVSTGKMVMIQK